MILSYLIRYLSLSHPSFIQGCKAEAQSPNPKLTVTVKYFFERDHIMTRLRFET